MTLPLFDRYPTSPGWKRRATSKAAAEAITPSAQRLRDQVYQLLKAQDLSADQCADLLEMDKLSIRPRLSELAKRNKIEDTGRRATNTSGKRSIIWRVK